MQFTRAALAALLLGFAVASHAEGRLENPAQGSTHTGIDVISGWHCTAQRIDIKIDDHPLIRAASGTRRDDTAGVCGGTNTGFSLLFNWNVLPLTCFGCAIHNVAAFADGVFFAGATFTVANFGVEFMTGKSATYFLPNFPTINRGTWLRWDENTQNFETYVTGSNVAGLEGITTYYGALQTGANNPVCGPFPIPKPPPQIRYATFLADYRDGRMGLTANYADGGQCVLAPVPIDPFDGDNQDGYVRATFGPACSEFPQGVNLAVNGSRLVAASRDNCVTAVATAAR